MTAHPPILWWSSLAEAADRWEDLETALPAEEQERAARFRIDVARQRFVLARTLVRRQLAEVLGAEPSSLVFGTAERGKPHLVSCDEPVGFNLSHSGDVVVSVVARTDVGVDVESMRPVIRAERLARRFFSPAELEAVLRANGVDRDRVFLRIWTQKEAWLKATGLGVGMPLRELETEPDASRPARVLAVSGDRDEAVRWSLAEVEIPGAVCTVALAGPPPELDVCRIASPDDLPT